MKRIVTLTIAAMLALGSAASLPYQAHAQDLELEIGRDGPKVRLRDRCDPRIERCRDDRRRDLTDDCDPRFERCRPREEFVERRVCTEDRALDKAERMGPRRARVVSAGRRTIEVRGRDQYGDRVSILFGRDRRCPVLN